jgi:hypothetical protein
MRGVDDGVRHVVSDETRWSIHDQREPKQIVKQAWRVPNGSEIWFVGTDAIYEDACHEQTIQSNDVADGHLRGNLAANNDAKQG